MASKELRANRKLGTSSEPPASIPDKLYFRIGEVAELCHVEPFVLRYWQTEFPQLRPTKSGSGQRLYRRRDVETALRIKRLLHDEGYTIAGARQALAADRAALAAQPALPMPAESTTEAADRAEARLRKLRGELRELLGILSQPPGGAQVPRRLSTVAPQGVRGPRLFNEE